MTLIRCGSNGGNNPFMGTIGYPSATYYNGVTYIVWQGGDNTFDPYITSFNHSTNVWGAVTKIAENPLTSDAHGVPAICVDADGFLHVFYGSHNSAQKHAKSDSAEDISAWTVQADAVAASATYPNCIVEGDNIYLFYRIGIATTGVWAYKKSADKGATWGGATTIINFSDGSVGIYCGNIHYDSDNDRFHLGWNYNAVPDRYNTYHAYLNNSDGKMYSMDGTDLGTTITKAEADANCLINDSGSFDSTQPTIHLDSNNYPHLIWSVDTAGDWDIKHRKWNGGSWDAAVTITTQSSGGGGFDFIIRDNGTIEMYGGIYDVVTGKENIEYWRYASGVWSLEATILTEDKSGRTLSSAQIPYNFNSDLELVFCETTADLVTFTMKIYALLYKILIRNESEWEFGTKTNIQTNTDRGTVTVDTIELSYSKDLLDEDCEGTDEADVTTVNTDFSGVTKAGADTIKFETDVKQEESSSIRIVHAGPGNNTFLQKDFGSEKSDIWINFWRRCSVSSGRLETFRTKDDDGDWGVYIIVEDKKINAYFNGQNNYIKADGSTSITKADGADWLEQDIWYGFEIVTNTAGQTYDIYLDGVKINNAALAMRDAAYDGERAFDYVMAAGATGTYYVDNIYISDVKHGTSGIYLTYTEFMHRDNKQYIGNLTIDYSNATGTYTLTPKILRASDDAVLWTGSAITSGSTVTYTVADFGQITDDFKVEVDFAGDGVDTPIVTEITGEFRDIVAGAGGIGGGGRGSLLLPLQLMS